MKKSEDMFDSVKPYKDQSYNKLKKESISSGKLFIDPEFPPQGSSLSYSKSAPADVVWKRPGEIVSDPKFFVDGASADDFSQGSIGNCWFVAACACIAEDQKLLKKVIPSMKEQEWHPDNKYAGIFHFTFWHLGEWVDVVIDDYLPTRNGRLIYVHSKSRNEFWSPLLEKAYAKLFGDYESLEAGKAKDAMVDMTGGVGEGLDIEDYKTEEDKMKLFKILQKSIDYRSLMSASITASGSEMEAKLSCGLVKGHAYSITSVKDIKLGKGLFAFFKREKIHMIRLRNPWGGTEWNGAWSDGSEEWKNVSKSEQAELGLMFDDNGEFWMSFEDFFKHFTSIDICHMINTSFFSLRKTWKEGKAIGEWINPDRCGGCGNHESFLNNPQGYSPGMQLVRENAHVACLKWCETVKSCMGCDKGKSCYRSEKKKSLIGKTVKTRQKSFNANEGIGIMFAGFPHFVTHKEFIFDITDETDEIMVSLEQYDKRIDRDKGEQNDTIGFTVMKTDLNRVYRMHDKLERISSGPFSNSRSVFNRVEVTQGRYCIIPSTFDPGKLGKFVLRIYSSSSPSLKELVDDEPPPPKCCCFSFGKPKIAGTQVTIVKAESLPAQDRDGSSDPYCLTVCEGEKVKTRYIQDSLNPKWDTRMTFYHKDPNKDIIIEVWNYNPIKDDLMGVVTIPMVQRKGFTDKTKVTQYSLYGKGKEAQTRKQGHLWVSVYHTTDMRAV